MTRLVTSTFDHAHTKNFDQLLIFVNLYQQAKKNSLFHLFILQIKSILESHHQIDQTHFWPCLPHFWDQTGHTHFWQYPTKKFQSTFSKNLILAYFCPLLQFWGQKKKLNDPIPRKHHDTQYNGRMDRPYHIPTTTTAVDWYLKIKYRVWCWFYQNLLHHSQHAKNQLNS